MLPVFYDPTSYLADLESIRHDASSATGTAGEDLSTRVASIASAIAVSVPTMEQPIGEWAAFRDDDGFIVTGPDFLMSADDAGSVSVVCGSVSWTIAAGATMVTEGGGLVAGFEDLDDSDALDAAQGELDDVVGRSLSMFDDDEVAAPVAAGPEVVAPGPSPSVEVSNTAIGTAGVGTVLGGIAAREIARRLNAPRSAAPAAPAVWTATHVVGRHRLEVGGVPNGTFAPGTMLDAGLPVRVIETTPDGWALVECSNAWQCYVAAWGLERIGEAS